MNQNNNYEHVFGDNGESSVQTVTRTNNKNKEEDEVDLPITEYLKIIIIIKERKL